MTPGGTSGVPTAPSRTASRSRDLVELAVGEDLARAQVAAAAEVVVDGPRRDAGRVDDLERLGDDLGADAVTADDPDAVGHGAIPSPPPPHIVPRTQTPPPHGWGRDAHRRRPPPADDDDAAAAPSLRGGAEPPSPPPRPLTTPRGPPPPTRDPLAPQEHPLIEGGPSRSSGWYLFIKSDPEPPAKITKTTTVGRGTLDGNYRAAPGDANSFVGYRVQRNNWWAGRSTRPRPAAPATSRPVHHHGHDRAGCHRDSGSSDPDLRPRSTRQRHQGSRPRIEPLPRSEVRAHGADRGADAAHGGRDRHDDRER